MSDRKAAGNDTAEQEPGPKRRRLLLDAGGPIEDDETARQKMRDALVFKYGTGEGTGFDPDNVRGVKVILRTDNITAMSYFTGDLPMMRWLYVNGADTRDVDIPIHFPMRFAAFKTVEICQWLFDYGAAADIKRRTDLPGVVSGNCNRPLSSAFKGEVFGSQAALNRREVGRWLILNGALCKDDNNDGELDIEIMREDLNAIGPRPTVVSSHVWESHRRYVVEERRLLLEWATDLHRAHTSFLLFMSGALPDCRYSSPVKALGGKSGVMELIGDFTGIVRGREARIIRQLTEQLPAINKELDAMHSE